jgi:hypothetical protein
LSWVTVEAVAVYAAVRVPHHRGHDVAAEIMRRAFALLVGGELVDQDVAVEHVDPHGDEVGLRAVGLLLELDDAVVLVRRQHAVTVRLRHRDFVERYRNVCALRDVVRDELVIVHLVDVVAGEDEHQLGTRLLEEVDVLGDGIGRAAVPVAAVAAEVRLQQRHATPLTVEVPRAADPDVVVQ